MFQKKLEQDRILTIKQLKSHGIQTSLEFPKEKKNNVQKKEEET
jgi:hypothetical protein